MKDSLIKMATMNQHRTFLSLITMFLMLTTKVTADQSLVGGIQQHYGEIKGMNETGKRRRLSAS
jgi:hypothetical protein